MAKIMASIRGRLGNQRGYGDIADALTGQAEILRVGEDGNGVGVEVESIRQDDVVVYDLPVGFVGNQKDALPFVPLLVQKRRPALSARPH